MPGKKPSRFWKRIRQLLLAGFLLLLAPVLIWWIYNRIDEKPSEAALRLSAPSARVVADEDNAWMHLFGIGAAQDKDVLSYARARLVASYADGVIDADGAPNPPLDPVPAVLPDADVDGADALCSPREQDCIVEYTKTRAMVERLRAANVLRLQRYESMLSLRDWQAQLPASQALSALPDASVATLYLNIVAQELAQAHNTRHLSDALEAAARLQKAHTFWSELRKQPMDLYAIVLSTRQLDDIRRLAWQYSNLRGETNTAIESVLDEILGSAAAPIQWRDAVASDFRARENYFHRHVPSTFASLRSCFDANTRFGCLTNAATALAYAPQATINLTAREMEAMQVWLEADARSQDSAANTYSQVVESQMVQFDDAGVIWRQMSHNYAGRILASVAIPAVDWSMRIYDSEANRRMLWLQRQMHQKQIALNDVPAFLAQQDDALRNPYDGEPFVWDANFRELQFAPKAKKYWKRDRLTVPYDPAS